MELLPRLRKLPATAPQEFAAQVKNTKGSWIRGRLIALRQSAEATRWTQKRMRRRAQRSQSALSQDALEFAGYFMVWTTLSSTASAAQVLEWYRLRWQIELVFKRMKSILGVGHLPKTNALSAQAWLEGKLFVGLLIEKMIHTAKSISPWGYTMATAPQPMARN
jgi:hypothetical protein